MFATLQELKNLFGRSFVLGVFFPVMIVVAVSLGLYLEVFWEGLGAALASWEKLPLQIQLFFSIVGLIAITINVSKCTDRIGSISMHRSSMVALLQRPKKQEFMEIYSSITHLEEIISTN